MMADRKRAGRSSAQPKSNIQPEICFDRHLMKQLQYIFSYIFGVMFHDSLKGEPQNRVGGDGTYLALNEAIREPL